jgi:Tol biopolymer transport system component
MAPGIFVSRLDGTERRLLIQLDTWMIGLPLWSPDGNWLAFLATNTDTMRPEETPGLVNVETCQVVPLANLDGAIQSWVNP